MTTNPNHFSTPNHIATPNLIATPSHLEFRYHDAGFRVFDRIA